MVDGERRRFSHVLEFKNKQAKAVAPIKSCGSPAMGPLPAVFYRS